MSSTRRLQHSTGLRRQGALRRWHPIGGSVNGPARAAHRFLSRLIDESLFPEMNIYRSHTVSFFLNLLLLGLKGLIFVL